MVASLPLPLKEHIYRTRDLARRLGKIHGVDDKRCALGALSHDLARHLEGSQLLIQSREKNIPINQNFLIIFFHIQIEYLRHL